jgi:N-acetylmuramoyl-L-alanine amidase
MTMGNLRPAREFLVALSIAFALALPAAGTRRTAARPSSSQPAALSAVSASDTEPSGHRGATHARHARAARPRSRPVIAIDPGHGGADSGAVNLRAGIEEKDVALDIAQRVRALLERSGYRVVMSRTADERLRPAQRLAWLQGLEARLLVSIHCDSTDDREDTLGATTYFHAGSQAGQALAAAIQHSLVRATGAADRGARPDTTRYESGFYILRNARQPAVLVEAGYISHLETALRFQDPRYCQRVARGIVTGIGSYLGQIGEGLRTRKRERAKARPQQP